MQSVSGLDSERNIGNTEFKAKDAEIKNLKKLLSQLDAMKNKKEQDLLKQIKELKAQLDKSKSQTDTLIFEISEKDQYVSNYKQKNKLSIYEEQVRIFSTISWFGSQNDLFGIIKAQIEENSMYDSDNNKLDMSNKLDAIFKNMQIIFSQMNEKITSLENEMQVLNGIIKKSDQNYSSRN